MRFQGHWVEAGLKCKTKASNAKLSASVRQENTRTIFVHLRSIFRTLVFSKTIDISDTKTELFNHRLEASISEVDRIVAVTVKTCQLSS